MSLESIRKKAQDLVVTFGRAAAHAEYPNDFEYYAISFELVDKNFNTLELFHMPVLPTAIQINRQSPLNIKKTGNGYFNQFSDSFQSSEITLSGTFGRKFRLLLHKQDEEAGFTSSTTKFEEFDKKVKTGYGTTKLMENMFLQSQKVVETNSSDATADEHKFLIFYNLTFNQQFIVEVMNYKFSQSTENNVMWNYDIQLKTVADLRSIVGFSGETRTLKNLLNNSMLNKGLNGVFNNLTAGGVLDPFKGFGNTLNQLNQRIF